MAGMVHCTEGGRKGQWLGSGRGTAVRARLAAGVTSCDVRLRTPMALHGIGSEGRGRSRLFLTCLSGFVEKKKSGELMYVTHTAGMRAMGARRHAANLLRKARI